MACIRGQALARRDPPFLERVVPGTGHKDVIVLGVEGDAGHRFTAMVIVGYIVTDTDRPQATGDRGLRAPMLVTAAKTLVFANLCAVNSLPQMPCSMSQMRTVLSKLPVARRLLSELQPRHVTPSLPSQRVSYAVTDTDRPGDR